MIDIHEALDLVANNCLQLPGVPALLDQLAGHVLAEDVQCDLDSPPFDKSMMDGFAIRASDVQGGKADLKIVARVTAGSQFDGTVQTGHAVQIMTGAPIPAGADAVVMVEQTTENDNRVSIDAEVVIGQNILSRATAMQCGQTVMNSGDFIRGEDIGLLAEAGVDRCEVVRRPTLAVIATGDELIDASFKPAGGQIRNSNGPMLASLARPCCSAVMNLGIGPDNPQVLAAKIAEGLRRDVLVLSGGVSAGVADLVPGILQDSGVQQIFHKVKIKPGKPVWFGVLERADTRRTLVFGLPGNPVSSMVCFRVFVAPALLRLAGRNPQVECLSGKLAIGHTQRPGRTTYWPSKLTRKKEGWEVRPLDWKGSADLRTLVDADCFCVFSGDRDSFQPGESIPVLPMG